MRRLSEISASEYRAADTSLTCQRATLVEHVLSLLLVVGLPAAFWLAVLELANYALSLGLSATFRLIVAGVLVTVLTMIWACIIICARQGVSLAVARR